jgi:preprotein translocase subunit YajC
MTTPAPLVPLASILQAAPPAAPAGTQGSPAGGDSSQAPSAGPFGGNFLIPMVLIMVVFYFVLIGPERKQRKKREAMLKTLAKGDKVMTQGGLYASVAAVADDMVTLQVADGVRMRFARSAIQSVTRDEEPAKDADKKA